MREADAQSDSTDGRGFLRSAQMMPPENCNPVRQGQSLFLIVGNINGSDAEFLLHPLQLVPKLNEQGIPYHVTQNTDAAIVTFSKADAARVNDLHKSLQPVVGSPSEAPKKIGNTPYHQIENKSYVRIANEAINAVMQGLDEKGIHYSGLIDAVKGNVITVSKADKPLVIQLQQNALEQKPSTVADTAAVSYRFKNVTAAELAQIKSADIQIAASKQKDDGFIIKIAAQDAKRIDAVLASGCNTKKLK